MFTKKKAAILAGMEPLIILGRGHSGTRLYTQFCEVLGYRMGSDPSRPSYDPHRKAFSNCIKKTADAYLQGNRQPKYCINNLIGSVYKYWKWIGKPVQHWGWKFPETYLIVPLVAEIFPRARYLHVVRDGRDIAFKRHLTDRVDRSLGRWILMQCRALDDPHPVQAAKSWAFQIKNFESVRSCIPPTRLLDLHFEDMVSRPVESARTIAEFLGVQADETQLRFLADHVDPAKQAQYKKEDPAMVARVEAAVQDPLIKYGYLPATGTDGRPDAQPQGAVRPTT